MHPILSRLEVIPYDGFNDRFLILTRVVGSLTEYFLNYCRCVLLLFQVKARHSCIVDDHIVTKDCGTCIA